MRVCHWKLYEECTRILSESLPCVRWNGGSRCRESQRARGFKCWSRWIFWLARGWCEMFPSKVSMGHHPEQISTAYFHTFSYVSFWRIKKLNIYGNRKSPVFLRSFFSLENKGLPLVGFTKNPLESSPNPCHVSGGGVAAHPKKPKKSEASNAGAGAFFDWLGDGVRCFHQRFPLGITLNRSEQHIFIYFHIFSYVSFWRIKKLNIYGNRKSPVFLRSGFFPLENEGLPLVSFTKNPWESSPNPSHVSGGTVAADAENRKEPEASNAGAGAFFLIGSGMVWNVSMKGFHGVSPWTDLNRIFSFVSSWRMK